MRRNCVLLTTLGLAILAGCSDSLNSKLEFFNRARFISTKAEGDHFISTYAINRPFKDVSAKAERELKEKGWTQIDSGPSHKAFSGIIDYDQWRVVQFELRPSQNSRDPEIAKTYPDGTEVVLLKYAKKD